jgi:hypothetical protein
MPQSPETRLDHHLDWITLEDHPFLKGSFVAWFEHLIEECKSKYFAHPGEPGFEEEDVKSVEAAIQQKIEVIGQHLHTMAMVWVDVEFNSCDLPSGCNWEDARHELGKLRQALAKNGVKPGVESEVSRGFHWRYDLSDDGIRLWKLLGGGVNYRDDLLFFAADKDRGFDFDKAIAELRVWGVVDESSPEVIRYEDNFELSE